MVINRIYLPLLKIFVHPLPYGFEWFQSIISVITGTGLTAMRPLQRRSLVLVRSSFELITSSGEKCKCGDPILGASDRFYPRL